MRVEFPARTAAPVHQVPTLLIVVSVLVEIDSVLELLGQSVDGRPVDFAVLQMIRQRIGLLLGLRGATHRHAHRWRFRPVASIDKRRFGPDGHNFLCLSTACQHKLAISGINLN